MPTWASKARLLFVTKKGRRLTLQIFSSVLDTLLTQLKPEYRSFNIHSFRIRAATSAAQAMIPDSQIKMLGVSGKKCLPVIYQTPLEELAKLIKTKLIKKLATSQQGILTRMTSSPDTLL